jgi:hypothetical protein
MVTHALFFFFGMSGMKCLNCCKINRMEVDKDGQLCKSINNSSGRILY